jgi:murein L,D-transpeptidase YafK
MNHNTLIAVTFAGAFMMASTTPFLGKLRGPLPNHVTADSILIEKSTHRMSLLKDGQVLRTYSVALGRGGPEPKSREGDARTPEGTYVIDRHNPRSCCHLALHISYPNAWDVASARVRGVNPGGDIEIHGLSKSRASHRTRDWTNGCIAVTNNDIEEIWRAVPDGTPIVIRH